MSQANKRERNTEPNVKTLEYSITAGWFTLRDYGLAISIDSICSMKSETSSPSKRGLAIRTKDGHEYLLLYFPANDFVLSMCPPVTTTQVLVKEIFDSCEIMSRIVQLPTITVFPSTH
jgi:hypothetical protein